MPRGRHRHSPPLHKLLHPTSVATVAVVCAGGVWAVSDPLLLRGLAMVAGAVALAGAVLMRTWDREAGRQVAELTRARESDQWKTDERVAELEADVEEAREIRTRLDGKLRAKRVELARLRGEHAALLRRYATAETERASALEGRRRLAIAATAEPKALTAGGAPSPSAYLMATKALDELAANGARQAALPAAGSRRAVESSAGPAEERTAGGSAAPLGDPVAGAQPAARHAGPVAQGSSDQVAVEVVEAGEAAEATGATVAAERAAGQASQASAAAVGGVAPAEDEAPVEGRPALPARRPATPSAIVPYARRTQHRPEQRPGGTGFDFFGTQHGGRTRPEPAGEGGREHTDAEEAPDAEGRSRVRDTDGTGDAVAARKDDAAPEVIDLTEHDDTEQLEMQDLRSALGS